MANQAQSLRKAIENLINAKLHDALAKPGGLDRLIAHRVTGVASWEIRNAEKQLDQALCDLLEALRSHVNGPEGGPALRPNSRRSHALASPQSRSTVRSEIFNTAAISSSVNPPK